MRLLIIILSVLLISACDQFITKGKTRSIDADYLSYLCIDSVKYIKSLSNGGYSLAPKFQSNGTLETCNDQ